MFSKFSLGFVNLDLDISKEILYGAENSDETLWECLILL